MSGRHYNQSMSNIMDRKEDIIVVNWRCKDHCCRDTALCWIQGFWLLDKWYISLRWYTIYNCRNMKHMLGCLNQKNPGCRDIFYWLYQMYELPDKMCIESILLCILYKYSHISDTEHYYHHQNIPHHTSKRDLLHTLFLISYHRSCTQWRKCKFYKNNGTWRRPRHCFKSTQSYKCIDLWSDLCCSGQNRRCSLLACWNMWDSCMRKVHKLHLSYRRSIFVQDRCKLS